MRIVLYQPGIAANFGNILRTAVCFACPVSVIEPLGFPLSQKDVRRAAMDYGHNVQLDRHANWAAYRQIPARRVLLTTRGETSLDNFAFRPDDHLVFGNESHGVPDTVHADCDVRIVIPIAGRSLNLSNAVAITVFEGLRQTDTLAKDAS